MMGRMLEQFAVPDDLGANNCGGEARMCEVTGEGCCWRWSRHLPVAFLSIPLWQEPSALCLASLSACCSHWAAAPLPPTMVGFQGSQPVLLLITVPFCRGGPFLLAPEARRGAPNSLLTYELNWLGFCFSFKCLSLPFPKRGIAASRSAAVSKANCSNDLCSVLWCSLSECPQEAHARCLWISALGRQGQDVAPHRRRYTRGAVLGRQLTDSKDPNAAQLHMEQTCISTAPEGTLTSDRGRGVGCKISASCRVFHQGWVMWSSAASCASQAAIDPANACGCPGFVSV